jgi:parallel beta-helix repeat protein
MAKRPYSPDVVAATLVVAASDSLHPERADYHCTGVNDHLVIQAALDALPATGGEVLLLDGTYHCEVSISLDTNQTLRGCGRNTILTTSTADLIFLSAVGGAGTEKVHIVIADLQIDGGAGLISACGIYFEYVDYSLIHNVYSRRHSSAFPRAGIYLSNSDFNTITENTSQGNYAGIYLEDCNNNSVSTNICQGNGTGIYPFGSNNNSVTTNICQGNYHGIYIQACNNNSVIGNICGENGYVGISIMFSHNNSVIGNICFENSQDTTNSYDNIYLEDSDYNNIQTNTCRAGALANKPRYGINISNAACDGNLVTNNDLHNDGFGTGSLNDAGTGTVTAAGNRV